MNFTQLIKSKVLQYQGFFKKHNYTKKNNHWLGQGRVGGNHLLIDYNGQLEKQKGVRNS